MQMWSELINIALDISIVSLQLYNHFYFSKYPANKNYNYSSYIQRHILKSLTNITQVIVFFYQGLNCNRWNL